MAILDAVRANFWDIGGILYAVRANFWNLDDICALKPYNTSVFWSNFEKLANVGWSLIYMKIFKCGSITYIYEKLVNVGRSLIYIWKSWNVGRSLIYMKILKCGLITYNYEKLANVGRSHPNTSALKDQRYCYV